MAGEDFTGPPVLNDQSGPSLAGRVSVVTPASDGEPRYMGQSAAALASVRANNKLVQCAAFIQGNGANSMATLNRLPGIGKLAISAVKIVAAENVSDQPSCKFRIWFARCNIFIRSMKFV